MARVPRLALATSPTGPDPSVLGLALLGALSARGRKVQHFRAWACPLTTRPAGPITGLPGRHLDAWLMPPSLCRSVFVGAATSVDLSIVEGTLSPRTATTGLPPTIEGPCACRSYAERPGDLTPLLQNLNLPCVYVVDCREWDSLHVPWVPPQADAVMFDNVPGPEQLEKLRLMVRMVHGKPTLGALGTVAPMRERLLSDCLSGNPVPRDLLAPLARSMLSSLDWNVLDEVANSRPLPPSEHGGLEIPNALLTSGGRRFRVAYAQDDAFGGYFPDTLEALEMLGAELVEFSPLSSEMLPQAVDLVMIGCGFPDRYAHELSANACLVAELQAHVCRGQRIYAEGGGAAYLGRSMIVNGRPVPGAGILPFDAELVADVGSPEAVERELINDSWIAGRGTVVRGYRSGRWNLLPAPDPGDCPARSGRLTAEPDIGFRSQAVGSLIHLHLGALPDVVAGFAGRKTPGSQRPSLRH